MGPMDFAERLQELCRMCGMERVPGSCSGTWLLCGSVSLAVGVPSKMCSHQKSKCCATAPLKLCLRYTHRQDCQTASPNVSSFYCTIRRTIWNMPPGLSLHVLHPDTGRPANLPLTSRLFFFSSAVTIFCCCSHLFGFLTYSSLSKN